MKFKKMFDFQEIEFKIVYELKKITTFNLI